MAKANIEIALGIGDFAGGSPRIARSDIPSPPRDAIFYVGRNGDKVYDTKEGDTPRRWRYRKGNLIVFIEYKDGGVGTGKNGGADLPPDPAPFQKFWCHAHGAVATGG